MSTEEAPKRPTRSPGPTVEQAHAFWMVAEEGSYKGAAERLGFADHVAVLRLVNRFTKALDRGPLVHSSTRGEVVLTALGREIVPAAKRYFEAAQALTSVRPEVRFSSYPAIAGRVAAFWGGLLDARIPLVLTGVSEASREDSGATLVKGVAEGRLDLVIAPAGMGEGLMETPLYSWKLRVVVPDGSPLAGKKRVRPADIAALQIAAAPRGHTSRGLLSKAFALDGLDLHVALESPNPGLLRAVVKGSSRYVAVMPDDSLEGKDLRNGPELTARDDSCFEGNYSLYMRPLPDLDGVSPEDNPDAATLHAAEVLRQGFKGRMERRHTGY
jgi:DNA-binding transcriptional LysR family regulator